MVRFKVVWENKEEEFIFAKSIEDAWSWAEDEAGMKKSSVKAVTPAILVGQSKLEASRIAAR